MAFCRSCGAQIDEPAPKCPKCGASQDDRVQRKWSIRAVVALAVVLLIGLLATVTPAYQDHQRRALEDAAVREARADQSAEEHQDLNKGTLKIWVPSGLVGDDYWVYLDGHIVSAPPRTKSETINVASSLVGATRWLTFGNDETLAIRDGDFTSLLRSYIDRNIDPATGDAQHLFYPVDLQLPSGKYVIEVAYVSKGHSSFPFAITRKYVANVRIGQRTQAHVGVPNDWTDQETPRATAWACSILPDNVPPELRIPTRDHKPNVSGVTQDMERYLNDPAAQALHALNMSVLSRPKGVVVLDFPQAQGGTREFDRSQIRYIAKAILDNYLEPSHEDVARCKQTNPEFSQSYIEYDKIISDIENELRLFHRLAGNERE